MMATGWLQAVFGLLAVVTCDTGAPAAGAAERTAYVPAPRPPSTGRYLVGAVLCPLWNDGRRWAEIEPYPDREPALGWYDEGNPEVTDWEITWALDHGISFFMVCWYRAKGNFDENIVRPTLGHWIHDGLFRSRYGDRVKFAIMWDNANKALPTQTSAADFAGKLVPFWIEHYFSRPNYLVLDGKPVFSIFSPEKFVDDLGGEAPAAAALGELRQAAVRAGFKGVHVLGQNCWGSPSALRQHAVQISRIGMEASWAYHWPTFTGAFGSNLRPTGAQAIAAQERLWATQPAPNLLTVSIGWDEAPWRFRYSKAQWRLTPAEFELLCQRAKDVLDRRPSDALEGRIVLLDNWNEFGEGHYIFPTRAQGFGYLDAVRDVFAPGAPAHADLVPSEIGRGPYDSQFRAWRQVHGGKNKP